MGKVSWSLRFNECRKCGTSEVPHKAQGLCLKCYATKSESKNSASKRLRGIAHSILTKEFLTEQYVINGKSLGDIAKLSNCSRQYVMKRVKELGVTLRNKSSARRLAYKADKLIYERIGQDGMFHRVEPKLSVINESFFETWSDAMAYVLGLIFTDGCLDPGRKMDASRKTTCPFFTLGQNDKSFLEQVLLLMKTSSTICYRPETHYSGRKQGALYSFRINSERIYDSLVNLGLKPHKSLDVTFPKVPPPFLRHFIRGCWDGDGSVYVHKRKTRKSGAIAAHFISGSRQFINGMVCALDSLGLPHRNIYKSFNKKTSNTYYYIRFISNHCRLLYHQFYDGVPSTHYLLRKKLVFDTFFAAHPKQHSSSKEHGATDEK